MIDLRKYYLDNVTEDDYYHIFFSQIEGVNEASGVSCEEQTTHNFKFLVHDEIEAIEKFRSLCQPKNRPHSKEDTCWFYIVAYYLNACSYVIEQFPDVLRRPPKEPSDFTYGKIRDRALSLELDENGTVRWDTRRRLVSETNFVRKSSSVAIGETLDQIIQRISAGNKGFEEMEIDEQLREIANLIENLLKENGEFIRLDYSRVTLEYIDDETVKRLRKQLQCFRHSSNESLDERARFSKEQKEFLIDFGVTICRAIWASRN